VVYKTSSLGDRTHWLWEESQLFAYYRTRGRYQKEYYMAD
jgi:hypothetical protein